MVKQTSTIDDELGAGETERFEVDTRDDSAVRVDIAGDAQPYDVDIETTAGQSVVGSATVNTTLPDAETVTDTDEHNIGTKGVKTTTAIKITNNSGGPARFTGKINRNAYESPESDDSFVSENGTYPQSYRDGRTWTNCTTCDVVEHLHLPAYQNLTDPPADAGTFNYIDGTNSAIEGVYYRNQAGNMVGLGLENLSTGALERFIVYKFGGVTNVVDTQTNTVEESDADAATAIQYAFDNLPAGRNRKASVGVVGEFSVSTAVTLPSDSRANLTHAYIEAAGNNDIFAANNVSNCDIVGGVLDGSNQTDGDGLRDLIDMDDCDRVAVEGTVVRNSGFVGVKMDNCNECRVVDVRASDNYHSAVKLDADTVGRGKDNVVANVTADGSTDTSSALFDDRGHSTATERVDTVFEGCVARNGAGSGFGLKGAGSDQRVTVDGCVSYNNAGAGVLIQDGVGLVTSTSAVANGAQGFMIRDTANTTDPDSRVELTNCISAQNANEGVEFETSRGSLSGCFIHDNDDQGLFLRGARHVAVSECQIFDQTVTDAAGVRVGSDTDGNPSVGCKIENSHLDNNDYGIEIGGAGGNDVQKLRVSAVDITNSVTSAYLNNGGLEASSAIFEEVDGISLTDLDDGAKYNGMVQESAAATSPQGSYDAGTHVDFNNTGGATGDGVYIIDAAGTAHGPI